MYPVAVQHVRFRPSPTLPMNEMVKDDQVYTPTEIAKVLRVSAVTVSRAIREGRLRAFRVGGQWRITGADVLRYVRSGTRQAMSRRLTGTMEDGQVGPRFVKDSPPERKLSPFTPHGPRHVS